MLRTPASRLSPIIGELMERVAGGHRNAESVVTRPPGTLALMLVLLGGKGCFLIEPVSLSFIPG